MNCKLGKILRSIKYISVFFRRDIGVISIILFSISTIEFLILGMFFNYYIMFISVIIYIGLVVFVIWSMICARMSREKVKGSIIILVLFSLIYYPALITGVTIADLIILIQSGNIFRNFVTESLSSPDVIHETNLIFLTSWQFRIEFVYDPDLRIDSTFPEETEIWKSRFSSKSIINNCNINVHRYPFTRFFVVFDLC